jgi:hypothetical protein
MIGAIAKPIIKLLSILANILAQGKLLVCTTSNRRILTPDF